MLQVLKGLFGRTETGNSPLAEATLLHQQGQLSRAEALYRQVLQAQPDEPNALHLLGVLTAQNGNGEEGAKLVRRAIALVPGNPVYRVNLGKILGNAGRVDESVSEYREALRLDTGYADAHFNLGIALLRSGNADEGLRCLSEAARLEPGQEEIQMQLGIALCQIGRAADAVQSFRAVLRIRPDHADAHNNLGVALRTLGQADDAVTCFERALEIDPQNARTHVNLGDTCALQGRFGEATESLRSALLFEPGNVNALVSLGSALAASGQPQEAVESFRKAVSLDSGRADAYCNLGLALHQLGSREEAASMLRRAVELAPGNGDIAANLRTVADGQVPMWHFSMMNDAERNAGYERAIAKVIRPDDHVLDIGTGAGLLAMMAARAGAKHVTTCEMVGPIAAKARQIVGKNGYGGKITVVPKISNELRVPENMPGRADVLIAEIISSELLGEGMLNTFEDARDRLLKPGFRVIPSDASILGQLAGSTDLDRYTRVEEVAGFHLEDFNEFTPTRLFPSELGIELEYHSAPFGIFDFDFQGQSHFPQERKSLSVTVTREGICRGVLQWIRLGLGGGVEFENSPDDPRHGTRSGHWQQILYLFPAPVAVKKGQVVRLVAAHNRRNLIFHFDGVA